MDNEDTLDGYIILEDSRLLLLTEDDVEFESITDVMDVGRDIKVEGEEARELFPEVVLSPGLS